MIKLWSGFKLVSHCELRCLLEGGAYYYQSVNSAVLIKVNPIIDVGYKKIIYKKVVHSQRLST